MEIDLNQTKEKLYAICEKYKGDVGDFFNSETYRKIGKGVETLDRIKEMTEEVSSQVEEGHYALQGVVSLVRKEKGDELEIDQRQYLEKLRKVYEGDNGKLKTLANKVRGNKYPSLKEALKIIENVAEKIPPYIGKLSNELSGRRDELTSLRSGLRKNIENLIDSRTPLEKDMNHLERTNQKLKTEYELLEKKRVENSSLEKKSEIDLVERLEKLEYAIGETSEKYTELETIKQTLKSDIDINNQQIKKLGQLMGLLDDAQKTVHFAKRFVDTQIPYIIGEVGTQRSEINSLFGVQRTLEFLEKQTDVSGLINDKIKQSLIYLDVKSENIRRKVLEKDSIYSEEPNVIKIKSSTPKEELLD
jgi:chromosome segregation ATPase